MLIDLAHLNRGSYEVSSGQLKGWRDGLVAKNTDCFSKGHGFNSHHSHSSLGLSLTPAPGDLVLPFVLSRHKVCMCHTDVHACKN